MLHESIYNKLWNRVERSKKSGDAEPKKSFRVELESCIRLAGLCRDMFSEKFYIKMRKWQ